MHQPEPELGTVEHPPLQELTELSGSRSAEGALWMSEVESALASVLSAARGS
jgi:hypothetical protein